MLLTPCGVETKGTSFGFQGKNDPNHIVVQVHWADGTIEVWQVGYRELEKLPRDEKNHAQLALVAGTGMPVVPVAGGGYAIPPQYWQGGVDNNNEMAGPGQGVGAKQGIRGQN